MTRPARLVVGAAGMLGALTLSVLVFGCTPFRSAVPTLPPSPVEGVIVRIDAASLSQVRGFTLRTSLGNPSTIDFVLGTLENGTEFPPGHLAEHQATSEPVRVYYRIEGGYPTAYRLEDAARVSPAPSAT